MPITLGANINSLAIKRALDRSTSKLTANFERLSSGLRINHASDDSAGLSIAAQLESGARIFAQGIRNVNDGVSAAHIAEGALTSLQDISQRQLELAEQAANGTYSLKQRQALNTEANALVNEFNRIVGSTTFNGIGLFDPSLSSILLQGGTGTANSLELDLNGSLRRAIGDGTFTAFSSFSEVGDPGHTVLFQAVIAGDFNGDGKDDYFITDNSSIGMIVIGNGDGSFLAPRNVVSGSGPTTALQFADVNGDGISDIVTGSNNQVGVLIGNGNGTFKLYKGYSAPSTVTSISVADFNGDGVNDIAANAGAGKILVYTGNSNGTFKAPTTINSVLTANQLSAADLNGDGLNDIVSINSAGSASIFLSNGNGSFALARTIAIVGGPVALAVGDFNGDGIADFAVGGTNRISIALGNGDGTFAALTTSPIVGNVKRVKTADFNGDGIVDLIALGLGGNASVLIGNGDGSFRAVTTLVTSTFNTDVAIGDFNGDGRSDVVTSGYLYNSTYYQYDGVSQLFFGNGSYTSNAAYLNINTRAGALSAISTINGNLNRISTQLGKIGAVSSRMGSFVENLQSQRINYLGAASRIMDADIASEAADLVRNQISQQAAASVLVQANLDPQIALRLLSG